MRGSLESPPTGPSLTHWFLFRCKSQVAEWEGAWTLSSSLSNGFMAAIISDLLSRCHLPGSKELLLCLSGKGSLTSFFLFSAYAFLRCFDFCL